MSTIPNGTANVRRRRVFGLVPLLLFVGLVLLFLIRLIAGDPSRIPSALIGQPAPQTKPACRWPVSSATAKPCPASSRPHSRAR